MLFAMSLKVYGYLFQDLSFSRAHGGYKSKSNYLQSLFIIRCV